MILRHARLFAAIAIPCATIIACSSAFDESSGTASEALGGCPAGQIRDPNGDPGPNGKIVHGCIADPNANPSDPTDDCYSQGVPQPSALYGANCQFKGRLDGQPVWECPAATVVPYSLGAVSSGQGACFDPVDHTNLFRTTVDPSLLTCEASWTGPSLRTNCLGGTKANGWTVTARAGFKLVADLQMDVYALTPPPWLEGGTGGCSGGCATPKPPFAQ